MLEFSDKYTNTSVPSTQPIDQAYAALYLASDMGRAVTGQVIQVDNGQFLYGAAAQFACSGFDPLKPEQARTPAMLRRLVYFMSKLR